MFFNEQISELTINLSQQIVTVNWDQRETNLTSILMQLAAIGYQGKPLTSLQQQEHYTKIQKNFLKRNLMKVRSLQILKSLGQGNSTRH